MTPLVAALTALLVAEHVPAPVAQARVAAVIAACEAAAPGDAFMIALCAWNSYQESRMDPDPCRHERDADGRPTCDRLVLAIRGSQAATKLGPPRAIGPQYEQPPEEPSPPDDVPPDSDELPT